MAESIEQSINSFKDFYKEQIGQYFTSLSPSIIEPVISLVSAKIKASKNTIYIFGNGGNSAIARHLATAFKDCFKDTPYSLRINCGVEIYLADPHDCQTIFTDILKTEKADQNDLVILISGSGDSDNLIAAARCAKAQQIPTLSFSAFGGGKISRGETDMAITIPVNDQQIGEDIMQILSRLIIAGCYYKINDKHGQFPLFYRHYIKNVINGLDIVSELFLKNLSQDICRAFWNGQRVYVLGPEGKGLNLSAEHVAHNLNWDVAFQVKNPPARQIFSSPTDCDFTGIGNDRLMAGAPWLQQLDKAQANDVLLLYAFNPTTPVVSNILQKAKEKQMSVYVVHGKSAVFNQEKLQAQLIPVITVAIMSDIVQIIGHMIGRLTRLWLKKTLGEDAGDITEFLIKDDMAQRRLLNKPSL